MVVAVVACSSIPVRESQLFGPSWCGCGLSGLMMMVPWDVTVAVSFRPRLRCRYPVKLRTELVGGWFKPTAVLLLPRMFYRMIQYGG